MITYFTNKAIITSMGGGLRPTYGAARVVTSKAVGLRLKNKIQKIYFIFYLFYI